MLLEYQFDPLPFPRTPPHPTPQAALLSAFMVIILLVRVPWLFGV